MRAAAQQRLSQQQIRHATATLIMLTATLSSCDCPPCAATAVGIYHHHHHHQQRQQQQHVSAPAVFQLIAFTVCYLGGRLCIVWPPQLHYAPLPVALFTYELIDLIVEVTDTVRLMAAAAAAGAAAVGAAAAGHVGTSLQGAEGDVLLQFQC